VGRNSAAPRERAAWVLKFAEMNLEGRLRADANLTREARQRVAPECARHLQWGELLAVHRRIREGLGALRSGQPWKYEAEVEHVVLPSASGLNGPLSGRFEAQWPQGTFVLNAMNALVAVGDRLRTCKRDGCGRVFVAVRRQQYCAECAEALQKAWVTAWRRRNAQRVRDLAHEAYVRRKRREAGRPNLKIERRPRVGRPGRT